MAKARYGWVITTIQWLVLAILAGFAIFNAWTDHGIQMAVNCISIGFMLCAMLAGKLMNHRLAKIDEVFAEMKAAEAFATAAAAKFEQAVSDGSIEVIPMMPVARPPTMH